MAKIDYQTSVNTIDGEGASLTAYAGDVLLIVNTASECGFTPQYEGLQQLWETYRDDGLRVLGFPCNQFGAQEPGDNADIAGFCADRYGVSFPMHAKVDVNGSKAHPLFVQLTAGAPGLLGSKRIKWNFTKFLVARDGEILDRFAPQTPPEKLHDAIRTALKS